MRLRFAVVPFLVVLLFNFAPLSRAQTPESTEATIQPETTVPNGWVNTVAGNGTFSICGDGGPATAACLAAPADVAFDSSGKFYNNIQFYFADQDNCLIREVDSSGVIGTLVGTPGTCGYSGDNGPAKSAQLNDPASLAFDSAGNLYIADSSNNLIRKVDAETHNITTFAGTGKAGYTGDGGPASKAELHGPDGLAFDAAGNLYISDSYNNVVRIVGPAGNIKTYAGNGSANFSGDGGPAKSASLDFPARLAYDKARNYLYIADYVNASVRRVDSSGTITTVAGNGQYSSTYPGDGRLATTVDLGTPSGVGVDSAGNLFITDTNLSVIFEVSAATQKLKIVGGTASTMGFSGDGGPATSGQFMNPTAVSVDSAGNLYVSDQNNERIREIYGVGSIVTATAPPAFSPAGDIYEAAQTVTLSDATAGAIIYYTTNGTVPTKSSTLYKAPIAVDGTTMIQAIAIAGSSTSTVASAEYTIEGITANPTFSPRGGTFAAPQTVTISDSTIGAVIFYTTNGTMPTTGSTRYTAPIAVNATETIKAIAVVPGDTNSAVATAA